MTAHSPFKAGDYIPVSARALVARINRKLRPEGYSLQRSRGAQAYIDVGAYYTVNTQLNAVAQRDVDIEALAHELGALKRWERLAAAPEADQ